MDLLSFYHALRTAQRVAVQLKKLVDENRSFMSIAGDTHYDHALMLLRTMDAQSSWDEVGSNFILAHDFYVRAVDKGAFASFINATIFGKFESTRDLYDRAQRAASLAAKCYRDTNSGRFREARTRAILAFEKYAEFAVKAEACDHQVRNLGADLIPPFDASAIEARQAKERRALLAAL